MKNARYSVKHRTAPISSRSQRFSAFNRKQVTARCALLSRTQLRCLARFIARGAGWFVVCVFFGVTSACGATLPQPEYITNQSKEWVVVPYPPPPARVEVIPPSPAFAAVWVDGQWTWVGRWEWQKGRWVNLPLPVRFAPWAVRVRADGMWVFAAAYWVIGDQIFPDPLPQSTIPPKYNKHRALSVR